MNIFLIASIIIIIYLLISIIGAVNILQRSIDDLNEYHVYLAKKEADEAYAKLTEKQKAQN